MGNTVKVYAKTDGDGVATAINSPYVCFKPGAPAKITDTEYFEKTREVSLWTAEY